MELEGWLVDRLGEGRWGLDQSLAAGSEWRWRWCLLDVTEVLVRLGRESGRESVLRERWGLGTEAGGVGSGLGAELGEIEIGAGLVAHVHGLVQLSLGVVPVEDDAVETDADDFHHDLDDDADQGPVLVALLVFLFPLTCG